MLIHTKKKRKKDAEPGLYTPKRQQAHAVANRWRKIHLMQHTDSIGDVAARKLAREQRRQEVANQRLRP